MGTFKQSCPYCGTRIEVDDIYAGKKANCPKCGKVIELKPEPARPAQPPPQPQRPQQPIQPQQPQRPQQPIQPQQPIPAQQPQNPYAGNQGFTPPPQNPYAGNQGFTPPPQRPQQPQQPQQPYAGNQGFTPPPQNPYAGNQGFQPPPPQNPYGGRTGAPTPPQGSPNLAELTARYGGNTALAMLAYSLRWIWDFMMFRRMIYRIWAISVSFLETLIGTGVAIFFFVKGDTMYGFITIGVMILLRILWEWLMVFFAINDTLTTIKNDLESRRK